MIQQNLFSILKIIFTTKSWIIFQFTLLAFLGLFNFLSLTLLEMGITQRFILAVFAGFYCFNLIVFYVFSKKHSFKNNLLLKTLLSISFILMLFYFFPWKYSLIFSFLSMCCLFILNDFLSINYLKSFYDHAKEYDYKPQNTITLVTFSNTLLISAVMPLIGFLMDIRINYGIAFISILILIALIILFTNSDKITQDTTVKRTTLLFNDVSLIIYAQCFLSLIYNSVSFFCSYFLIPLTVFELAEEIGMSKYTFQILGVTLALVTLFSMVSNSIKKRKECDSNRLMLLNYSIGIGLWLIIILMFVLYKYDYVDNIYLVFGITIFCFLTVQITSKLWSIGFIDMLHKHSISFCPETKTEQESYRQAFTLFVIFKISGGALGFSLAFVLYDLLSPGFTSFLLGSIALIYGVFYTVIKKKYKTF